eukprot:Clim_evm156s147 gene=Clim_evmTU156s147
MSELVKRGPGRPRKDSSKSSAGTGRSQKTPSGKKKVSEKKRGSSKSPGDKTSEKKRGPGRPPKNKDDGSLKKRGPGRPPKSSTKRRVRRHPDDHGQPHITTHKYAHEWLRDNENLRFGYLHNHGFWDAIGALGYFHNQFVNSWSHILALLYFIIQMGDYLVGTRSQDLTPEHRWNFVLGCVPAAVCFLLSAIYHTFKCCSESSFDLLLKCDYLGIMVQMGGFFVFGTYYGFECYPKAQVFFGYLFTTLFVCLGLVTTIDPPWFDKVRIPVYVAAVCSALLPVLTWLVLHWPMRSRELYLFLVIIMHFACYGCGFFLYHTQIPEAWFPGRFDIFGASHQIWHVMCFMAAQIFIEGLFLHFREMEKHGCQNHDRQSGYLADLFG